MGELSVMASAAFSPGILHQEQALFRTPQPKDFLALPICHGEKQNLISTTKLIGTTHLENPCNFSSLLLGNQLPMTVPVANEPVLIDVQDAGPDSVLFSFGVAEQCMKHEKILKFLASGSNGTDRNDLDISSISGLMGFRPVVVGGFPQAFGPTKEELCLYDKGIDEEQNVIHPQKHFYAPAALSGFVGNVSRASAITVHPNGQVLFTGTTTEIKDLLSLVAEFDLSKTLSGGYRKSMVVPYFTRKRARHAQVKAQVPPSMFAPQTVVPSKSTEKSKILQKKQSRISSNERFSKNYFYACDCLLNMYLDNSGSRATILSLKDSGPELARLLSRFSAGIVGTGLAVLISFACKTMNGNAAILSAARLFNVTFGFGLFWLSQAVNRLQDNIYYFSKRSAKAKKPDEEIELVTKVRRSMNEIFFRFLALVAVGVLSL